MPDCQYNLLAMLSTAKYNNLWVVMGLGELRDAEISEIINIIMICYRDVVNYHANMHYQTGK